jgi:hypothetical protein
MDRNSDYGFRDLREATYNGLPASIANRLRHVHFLCGVDPVYVGLEDNDKALDGRPFRNMTHCYYGFGQTLLPKDKRNTTIILPDSDVRKHSVEDLIHELGHCLNEVMGFYTDIEPVTKYAEVDDEEAFAEAFCSWLIWDYGKRPDNGTIALFRSLLTEQELKHWVDL